MHMLGMADGRVGNRPLRQPADADPALRQQPVNLGLPPPLSGVGSAAATPGDPEDAAAGLVHL